jgi:hypothetical protein
VPARNDGLDIDKLVGAAQTGLSLRAGDVGSSAADTTALEDKVDEIKKWWQRKTKRAKAPAASGSTGGRGQGDAGGWPSASGNPSGGGRSNNTGNSARVSLCSARSMVQQHAMEVHGINLSKADTATRRLHVRAAEAIACCPADASLLPGAAAMPYKATARKPKGHSPLSGILHQEEEEDE